MRLAALALVFLLMPLRSTGQAIGPARWPVPPASPPAAPPPDSTRFEFWVLAGAGVTSSDHLDALSTWPLATVGTGYAMSRRLSVELGATHRYLGRLGLSYLADGLSQYPQHEYVSLSSLIAGLTIMSTRKAAAKAFVSATAGLYLLRGTFGTRGFEPVSSFRPGFSLGCGTKGAAGARVPRADLRIHARAPDQAGYDYGVSRTWVVVTEMTVGVQF